MYTHKCTAKTTKQANRLCTSVYSNQFGLYSSQVKLQIPLSHLRECVVPKALTNCAMRKSVSHATVCAKQTPRQSEERFWYEYAWQNYYGANVNYNTDDGDGDFDLHDAVHMKLSYAQICHEQIPCRTAMRGSFPLNGTYFQVNEVRQTSTKLDLFLSTWGLCSQFDNTLILTFLVVPLQLFADHDSSINPIDVPRAWLWNLQRRTVYFGTSIPTIFKGKYGKR